MWIIIIVIAVMIVLFVLWNHGSIETFSSVFSNIEDDVSIGNQSSMSGRPNPYLNINLKGRQDPIIYQGQGVPLSHEDHPTTPPEQSMFYFADYSCKPECCLYSANSCSNGCVCQQAPPDKDVSQNIKLTPRS